MRILILGLNFAPELTGVGRCTAEFASWLSIRGHDVRVLTAPPYYPEWRIGAGYAAWRYGSEKFGSARVLRCPLWVPAAPTSLKRMLHLLSFAASSFGPCLWYALRWRPDLIWAVEPTACAAPTALIAARLTGARACLHIQDLEVEAALGLRMLVEPRLGRLARRAYAWLVRRFDLVSTVSRRMRERLASVGVDDERLCLFPNWVDTRAIVPLAGPTRLRRALRLAEETVIALYAGSMGEKQGLGGLAEVAERLRAHPGIHLVLCGAGAARPRLERLFRRHANVTLLPLQPEARLNELLSSADIHLMPQRAEAETFALPSKLAGILASGRPVVAQASPGELADAAARCGIVVTPGDASAMAAAIVELATDPARRRQLGSEARRFAERHLDREPIIGRYEQRLARLIAAPANTWQGGWAPTRLKPLTSVIFRVPSDAPVQSRRR